MGKVIKLNHITKIEGHARLNVKIDNGVIKKCDLNIFEGNRFFEGIMQCEKYNELPPIAARICGVCSVVHLLTSTKAVENALNLKVSKQTKLLRELIHLGGIIQSHALHLYFLALPDYYGFDSAIKMASKHKDKVSRALRMKKLGNLIVNIVGGRDVHPLTVVVGGISKFPTDDELSMLKKELRKARADFVATVELFNTLKHPKFEFCVDYYAISDKKRYNIYDGNLHGLVHKKKDKHCTSLCTIPTQDYEKHMKEFFQEKSTAEFAVMEGKTYMVGALPRFCLNAERLPKKIQKYIKFELPSYNPFHNLNAQAIETLWCLDRCMEIIDEIGNVKKEKPKKFVVAARKGIGVSEAPRGILFHNYTLDKDGYCKRSNITTPTSQNLRCMQESVRKFLPSILDKDKEEIKLDVEKLIRAYDPCISCSTHFLEMNWE
ncbi:Ni/Fe hydrogenase subunit alpha [Candidatus Woesearchaeota archaeon]|nr:Ni/Fe hydrogenase subunit alpha [Candidatus Woesearchaeota archaeon]